MGSGQYVLLPRPSATWKIRGPLPSSSSAVWKIYEAEGEGHDAPHCVDIRETTRRSTVVRRCDARILVGKRRCDAQGEDLLIFDCVPTFLVEDQPKSPCPRLKDGKCVRMVDRSNAEQ